MLAEKGLATGLLGAAVRTLGSQPPGLLAVAVDCAAPPETITDNIQRALADADYGRGVLILADPLRRYPRDQPRLPAAGARTHRAPSPA